VGAGLGLGHVWPPVLGVVVMVAVVVALLVRCTRRLGGVTGDVLGAAVEVSFAVLALAAAAA
jgi:adenosylcobinamide-GDP ribazoletransferase